MLKELEYYFDYFISKRTDEIGEAILTNNLVYRRLVEERKSSFEELLKNLPESCKSLVYDFEDKDNFQAAFANEIMYRQGLLDGSNFRNTLLSSHAQENFEGVLGKNTNVM